MATKKNQELGICQLLVSSTEMRNEKKISTRGFGDSSYMFFRSPTFRNFVLPLVFDTLPFNQRLAHFP
jgi:hypothetical protein